VIALNVAQQHFGRPADERAFIAVPHAGAGTARGGSIEDDGESEAWRSGAHGRWNVTIASDVNALRIAVERAGSMPHTQDELGVFVPMHETRPVTCERGVLLNDESADGWRCLTISIAP